MMRCHSAYSIRDSGEGLTKIRMYGCNLYLLSKSLIESWAKVGVHVWNQSLVSIDAPHHFRTALPSHKPIRPKTSMGR